MKKNSFARIVLALVCLLAVIFGTTPAFAGNGRLKASANKEEKKFEPTGLCLKPQHGVAMAVVDDGTQFTVYYQETPGFEIKDFTMTDKGLEIKTIDGKGSCGIIRIPEVNTSQRARVEIKSAGAPFMEGLKKLYPCESDK